MNNFFLKQRLLACEEAIKKSPLYSKAYFDRGDVLFDMKDYVGAAKDFTMCIRLDPKDDEAFYLLGLSYERLGRPEKALEQYSNCLMVNPNHVSAHNNRGVLYKAQGKFELAERDLVATAKLDPFHSKCLNNLGLVYAQTNRLKEAIDCLTGAIDLNPSYVNALVNRGQAYLVIGELELAKKDLEQALNINSKNQKALLLRAEVMSELDPSQNQTKENLFEALNIDPNNPELAKTALRLCARTKDFDNALTIINTFKGIGIGYELIENLALLAIQERKPDIGVLLFQEAANRGSNKAIRFLDLLASKRKDKSDFEGTKGHNLENKPRTLEDSYIVDVKKEFNAKWKKRLATFLMAETFEEMVHATKEYPLMMTEEFIHWIDDKRSRAPQISELFDRNFSWLKEIKSESY